MEGAVVEDPVVRVLEQVRNAHKRSLASIEECMQLPQGTYRHISRGRRPLPDFQGDLVLWIQTFENCVDASVDERKLILKCLSATIMEQFSRLLDDIKRHNR